MIPKYQPPDNEFTETVHVALKLRNDILAHPKHTGFVVTEDEMIECVPSMAVLCSYVSCSGAESLGRKS